MGNRISVLVVDDDAAIRDALSLGLSKRGYQVRSVGCASAALAELRAWQPDVALFDVCLPDFLGTELLARVRAEGLDTGVILMTAHADVASATSAVTHRALSYLQKPFDLAAVLSAVANAAELRRLELLNRQMVANLKANEALLRSQAAIAQARAAALDAVCAVSEAASRSLDRQEILGVALREVASAMRAGAEVLLLDESADLLRLAGREGEGAPPAVEGESLSLGAGIAGAVALSRIPAFVTISGAVAFKRPALAGSSWREYGCVPLVAKGRVFGVLGAGRGEPFDAREQALLPRLAAVIAVSLENALLFERAQGAVSSLRESQARLLENERLAVIGQLTAGLAHEINTPCAYIIANLHVLRLHVGLFERYSERVSAGESAELVLRELAVPQAFEESRQIVEECLTGGERIRRIVRDLRVFGRGARESRQPTDVVELLDSTLAMLGSEFRGRATVECRLKPCPQIEAHPGRLGQVFVHVLMNAVQSIPEGALERHTIEVSTDVEEERWLVVRVRDDGVGIPAEVLPRIFDPYFTTKPIGQGSGLGLALSLDILRHHGGELTVRSELGRGTEVALRLPLPVRQTQAPLKSSASRRRILVIDDEQQVLRALSRLVGREHDVVTVGGGAAALELLATDSAFDLVLCDLTMPEVDGISVWEGIRDRFPALLARYAVLSGGANGDRARNFLARERPAILEKPFGLDELRRLLVVPPRGATT